MTDPIIQEQAAIERLAEAIRFPTISSLAPSRSDPEAFLGFRNYLAKMFPQVHRTMRREIIGDHSLLFVWPGSEQSHQPVLFLAHQDVVPVEAGTESLWHYQPFTGAIADGHVWGRGTLDDKVRIVAMLEAVEGLLKESFAPHRTFMFAFGHDEEIGGQTGAVRIAALLKERGVRFEYVQDEGGAIITQGILPGVSRPIALIGIAEKGYLNIELVVNAPGGHSSMPPPQTAIGILSAAIHRLEQHKFPGRFVGATHQLAERLALHTPFLQRLMLTNLWLFSPLVGHQLGKQPATNAAIRTTLAATIVRGGLKDNLLPVEARAVVNLRLLPGDTIPSTIAQIERIIDDPRVALRLLENASEASAESPMDSWGYETLERSIRQVFLDVLVVPYLTAGATDARHYAGLSTGLYRFSPLLLTAADLQRIHGTNERISVENYVRCVQFYHRLIRNSDVPSGLGADPTAESP